MVESSEEEESSVESSCSAGPDIPNSAETSEEEEERKEETKKKKKERMGFRDRKIVDYENRIRMYSTPDKIFRYFATYKAVTQSDKGASDSGEIFMTPEDFLRSLTPGVKQPEGMGLDQFKKFDPKVKLKIDQNLPEDSIFYKLGSSGLISFSDYVFLLTILSTSRRQFEIAFRMFDLNGDGDVDAEEFSKVQSIIRQSTSIGSRHRDHANTGSTLKGINSALSVYFFGEKLEGKLTIERFLEFQTQLQREILALEFKRKEPNEDDLISEKQLAELLLTYADYSPKRKSHVLKRVKKAFKNGEGRGISLEDYVNIFSLLMNIDDVDKALSFYHLAGASISEDTLKHVANVCAQVDLSDHLVHVIFTIFDADGDGQLSNKEFVAVMKNKLKRGLEKPKDTGLFNLFAAIVKCAKNMPAQPGQLQHNLQPL